MKIRYNFFLNTPKNIITFIHWRWGQTTFSLSKVLSFIRRGCFSSITWVICIPLTTKVYSYARLFLKLQISDSHLLLQHKAHEPSFIPLHFNRLITCIKWWWTQFILLLPTKAQSLDLLIIWFDVWRTDEMVLKKAKAISFVKWIFRYLEYC